MARRWDNISNPPDNMTQKDCHRQKKNNKRHKREQYG
jgi:hypothetical protein